MDGVVALGGCSCPRCIGMAEKNRRLLSASVTRARHTPRISPRVPVKYISHIVCALRRGDHTMGLLFNIFINFFFPSSVSISGHLVKNECAGARPPNLFWTARVINDSGDAQQWLLYIHISYSYVGTIIIILKCARATRTGTGRVSHARSLFLLHTYIYTYIYDWEWVRYSKKKISVRDTIFFTNWCTHNVMKTIITLLRWLYIVLSDTIVKHAVIILLL